jgi:hypothetical protein
MGAMVDSMGRDSRLRHLPAGTRLEWRLAGSKLLARGIDDLVHRPRRWLHALASERNARIDARALTNHERRVFSQNGEDGIIDEIFRRIGTTNRFAVEFGIGDGSECCTRRLFLEQGWGGLLIEGSEPWARAAGQAFAGRGVQVVHSFITLDSILGIFAGASVPRELDLLVVDIDGNDYWILGRILSAYRPRAFVVEYNGRWVPPIEWVMPYDARHNWDGTVYFGASLASFAKLAGAHSYSLVGCDRNGVNAFFVRDDLLGAHFPRAAEGAAAHYVPPSYGRGFGHPVRLRPPRA